MFRGSKLQPSAHFQHRFQSGSHRSRHINPSTLNPSKLNYTSYSIFVSLLKCHHDCRRNQCQARSRRTATHGGTHPQGIPIRRTNTPQNGGRFSILPATRRMFRLVSTPSSSRSRRQRHRCNRCTRRRRHRRQKQKCRRQKRLNGATEEALRGGFHHHRHGIHRIHLRRCQYQQQRQSSKHDRLRPHDRGRHYGRRRRRRNALR
mmetsp:Transcript_39873/g.83368  ORF Transcript_39873/g.83368 Transcript_39873/m.83368 type:complete len:204 (+) Transcript_39873:170-781(+)